MLLGSFRWKKFEGGHGLGCYNSVMLLQKLLSTASSMFDPFLVGQIFLTVRWRDP